MYINCNFFSFVHKNWSGTGFFRSLMYGDLSFDLYLLRMWFFHEFWLSIFCNVKKTHIEYLRSFSTHTHAQIFEYTFTLSLRSPIFLCASFEAIYTLSVRSSSRLQFCLQCVRSLVLCFFLHFNKVIVAC